MNVTNVCVAGEYSCLKVDLIFKREFSYYLIQIYTPCCMLVIVSWVSFWLDQGAVPARVSLGQFARRMFIASKCSTWILLCRSNHLAYNGYSNLRNKRFFTPSVLHKGH